MWACGRVHDYRQNTHRDVQSSVRVRISGSSARQALLQGVEDLLYGQDRVGPGRAAKVQDLQAGSSGEQFESGRTRCHQLVIS